MGRTFTLLWIFRRIRRRIPALVLMTTANVGGALLGVVFALGTRQVIDSATSGDRHAFFTACLVQIAIILGINLCQLVFRFLRDRLTAELDRDWKQQLLGRLLTGDYTQVSAYHSAELVNRLNNDVKTVNDGILVAIPSAASVITKVVSTIAALTAMAPWLALVVITGGILLILVMSLARYHLKDMYKRVSEQDGKVSGFLQEILEKLLMVQAMDVTDEIQRRTRILLDQRYTTQRKRQNMSLFANTCMNVMYYAGGFVALAWCSFGLLDGSISFGALTAITQLVNQIQGPLVNISGMFPQYVAMVAAAERLMELEKLHSGPPSLEEAPQRLYRQADAVCAQHLSFSYDRDRIFDDAAFSLPKGAYAVITGPSGIGKSTLLKLLLGVFTPDSGSLFLQCGNQHIPLNRTTRRLFAYVPQGNLLLSGTLRENLTIVRPDATEEEIRQAVYVSAMEDYLPQLPQGLDTVLGESGSGLSEGQAQRLAIARAILSGAPIVLLDEATSALDAETEQMVLERIHRLTDRTCIAVTHRPAAVALSDWNLIIGDGKISSRQTAFDPSPKNR